MITIPDIPDGLIVKISTFFKFRRPSYRRAAKTYKCDECGENIEQSKSPRASKYQYMAWAPKDKDFVTPSGKHTETWRVCPKCLSLWRNLTSKVKDLDEVTYTYMPGKLIVLGEEVYKILEKAGKV